MTTSTPIARLRPAWEKLGDASGLALRWVADNAETNEGWEIRIAGAEVVDVFQQVGLYRDRITTLHGGTDQTLLSPVAVPSSPQQPRRGQETLQATLLPDELTLALSAATDQLQALSPPPETEAQSIPVDASRRQYSLGGDSLAKRQDAERAARSGTRALAEQCRDVQTGLLLLNQRLSMQLTAPQSTPGKDGAPDSPPAAGGAASDPAQRYRDQADKLRGRIDTFGKALGTIGTTLVTAAGVSRLDGLFPVPPGDTGLIWGTIASLVVGLAAILGIALRLNRVANPISLRSDIDDLVRQNEITWRESRVVREVYRRTYELNNARSLLAYELRGLRLRRIREWIGDKTCARICADRADEVSGDVSVTLARASVTLVRRRATRALAAGWAPALYAAFVAAIVGFAVCTSLLTSDQTGRIAILKSCGDAQTSLNSAGGVTTTDVTTKTVPSTLTRTTTKAGPSTASSTKTGPSTATSTKTKTGPSTATSTKKKTGPSTATRTTTETIVTSGPSNGVAGLPAICSKQRAKPHASAPSGGGTRAGRG